ncbi:unnamed protein product [Didymodactylos carnosus]|uniref:Adhesion regulating molecule 1 n=1 Tax=Didymodactylos carnosus TaxID=1234261 RepID=A0A815H6S0_9BILA|nr:unnamed protein product [Didymodactylos carnosus]CAF1350319.1 unnamed protein product [Didymodactylos carnosus]CAF3738329.1 unnamed protein product [Didymodactylos carnosus]CAF4219885.1 unnamed protein product [Didymodactylos carnosus]
MFGGAANRPSSRNLVEFKAGKMHLRGNMVHPDKRKGLVYLHQGNDTLMHLCWKDRGSSNSAPEDDLVIFPDEIEFKKVTQNTTGRVYILKWKNAARKLFFWMQEPKEDKDEELCKKINDLLNHPPTPGMSLDESGSGSGHPLQAVMERMSAGGGGGLDPNDLSSVLRTMNPNQLAELISSLGNGGGGIMPMHSPRGHGALSAGNTNSNQQLTPSLLDTFTQDASSRPNTAPASTTSVTRTAGATATPSTGTGTSGSSKPPKETRSGGNTGTTSAASASSSSTTKPAIQLAALESILSQLGGQSAKPSIDLYDIMTSENLVPILSNKDIQEKLIPHMPEGELLPKTEYELRQSIQSPQFRQAVSAFSVALQTGQLGPVLSQFGLPPDVVQAANKGDISAFAKAMEKHYKKDKDSSTNDNTNMDTS